MSDVMQHVSVRIVYRTLPVSGARWLIGVLWLALAASLPADAAPPVSASSGKAAPEYAADALLVKFRSGTSATDVATVTRGQGAHEARRFKPPAKSADAAIGRWWHVKFSKGRDINKAKQQLARHPQVEAVELDYRVHALATPNDPRYGELWGLNNIGQSGGTLDADIDAAEAWGVTTGSSGVTVAVIDTGIDYNHPDLAANIWVNSREIPGNGIDDDSNGYVDDVNGYDFANNDANPMDDHSHGTHVAGTIAAVGNNATGVVGVSWNTKLMAIKFLNAGGSGYESDAISAILYAANNGARILNNSWGGGLYSQALADAITASLSANALFVAAAGNEYSDIELFGHYPSSYTVDNVLSVAATDRTDTKAGFSNYGATTVDLGAPGADILSTVPMSIDASGYRVLSGTSMATPHVAGAAALLLAQNPALGALGLKNILMFTTDAVPSLAGRTVTGGRLNVLNALSCAPTQLRISSLMSAPISTVHAYLNEPVAVRASVMTCGTPVTGAQVVASVSDGSATLTLFDDGAHGDGAANDGIYANQWVPTRQGPATLTLRAAHPSLGSHAVNVGALIIQRVTYNYEVAPYLWNDISGNSSNSYYLDDEGSVTVPLGFDFVFYGTTFRNLTISSNGYLAFDPLLATSGQNTSLPSTQPPHGIIAPFWDDLKPPIPAAIARNGVGLVVSKVQGNAPNRSLTVSWLQMPMWTHSGGGGQVTFQAILYEGSNEIVFQYRDVIMEYCIPEWDCWPMNQGGTATVGIADLAGVQGLLYSYNQKSLSDFTALRFYPGSMNRRPLANPGGPYVGYATQALAFNGAGSTDPENDALTYRWDFGDGSTGTGVRPTHTYARKGTYTVSLVVNDGRQDSAPVTASVTVNRL